MDPSVWPVIQTLSASSSMALVSTPCVQICPISQLVTTLTVCGALGRSEGDRGTHDFSPSTAIVSLLPQLLRHGSVAENLEQDFAGNLSSWITEPDLIIKEIGLRGLSNLALHPGKVRMG